MTDAVPTTRASHEAVAVPLAPTPRSPPAGARLHWLDALRGLAALVVVYWHLGPHSLAPVPAAARPWLDIGKYGVVVFFIMSGYVIPLSLERHGSVRHFWISRIFRIYPAWLVVSGIMLALFLTGFLPTPASFVRETQTAVLAHGTMLQGLLGVSNLVPVYWTLSYEMVFYLLVAGLFTLGLHRHSGWIATALAGIALVVGTGLPADLLTGGGTRRGSVTVLLAGLLALVVIGALSGRRRLALGCAVLSVAAILLPAVNGGESASRASWQSLVLIAAMFGGSVVYRVERGQLHRLAGGGAILAVLAAALLGAWWYLPEPAARQIWASTVILAAATFALAYRLRRLRVPRVASWLGAISYPLYLLHLVLLAVLFRLLPGLAHRPMPVRVLALVGFLLVLLLACDLVHRYVESPGRRLGRRLAGMLDDRLGPDRVPAHPRPVRARVHPSNIAKAANPVRQLAGRLRSADRVSANSDRSSSAADLADAEQG